MAADMDAFENPARGRDVAASPADIGLEQALADGTREGTRRQQQQSSGQHLSRGRLLTSRCAQGMSESWFTFVALILAGQAGAALAAPDVGDEGTITRMAWSALEGGVGFAIFMGFFESARSS
jgi:hypothetical protein